MLVNDTDIYKNFDAIRNQIGFVPQKDIIHMELTVYQELEYAAQLRMPADTTPEERHQRIEQVTGVPIHMVSTSPDRDHTIMMRHPYLAD